MMRIVATLTESVTLTLLMGWKSSPMDMAKLDEVKADPLGVNITTAMDCPVAVTAAAGSINWPALGARTDKIGVDAAVAGVAVVGTEAIV